MALFASGWLVALGATSHAPPQPGDGRPLLLAQDPGCTADWMPASGSPAGIGAPWGEINIDALTVFDDGSGPALYAGGTFTTAGGAPASHIARWDGASWSALGSGVSGSVFEVDVLDLAVFDDGSGPALLAGGSFPASPAGDTYLARWGCAQPPTLGAPFCFGDGSGTACPCGNAGAAGEGCANSTGQGAILSATGSSSVGAGDLVLAGASLPPGQTSLFFQANERMNGGAGVVFGDGLRCAGVGVVRLQVVVSDSSGTSSTSIDIPAQGAVSPGDTRRYQLWYRDALASPCGSGFNLTNGLELTWEP